LTEKTGEIARETAEYRCENCHKPIHLKLGDLIPKCPNCGFETFDLGNPRFEKKDGTLGPHDPEADGT
jgi:Zn finger protein HypA/HybF involved in hydrogenase expression